LDGVVAEKLHKMPETYRIPRVIAKKPGKKRLSRIFRDREELPTSSNLSEEELADGDPDTAAGETLWRGETAAAWPSASRTVRCPPSIRKAARKCPFIPPTSPRTSPALSTGNCSRLRLDGRVLTPAETERFKAG
jgi:hypothetical protein